MVNDDPMFSIDLLGNIRNIGSPDREKVDWYDLTIRAEDLGVPSLRNTTYYKINVLDVNDNAPVCDEAYQVITVEQSVPIGTGIAQVCQVLLIY